MTKTDEQMDEAAAHARIIRINARNVGGDIIRYRGAWLKPMPF